MLKKNLLLILFFYSQLLFSQHKHTESIISPDTSTVYKYVLSSFFNNSETLKLNDTTLIGIQNYTPINKDNNNFFYNIGNTGLAFNNMLFSIYNKEYFTFTNNYFNLYLINNYNITYYKLYNSYSDILYVMGAGTEQIFNVAHNQSIARGLIIGADLKIINSIGRYMRQKSDNMSVGFTVQYVSNNEKYAFLANYFTNRLKWRENGGIKSDSLFTENLEIDRKRIPVNLSNAENRFRLKGFNINQFYYLKKAVTDTTFKKKHFFDPQETNFFRHSFTFSKQSQIYDDANPKSGFYKEILFDTIATYDSTAYKVITNELVFEGGIGRTKKENKLLLLKAGLLHSFVKIADYKHEHKYNYLTLFGSISANVFEIAKAEAGLCFTQNEPFNDDKNIFAELIVPSYNNLATWGNIKLRLNVESRQPAYFFQNYTSNHFSWINTFGQTNIYSFKATYSIRDFATGINLYNLHNWIYLNALAKPEKSTTQINILQTFISGSVAFNKFNINSTLFLQKLSNKNNVIHLPNFVGKASIYYQISIFKRALHLQPGLTLCYNSEFYPDSYMPALRNFYLQDTKKIGNYPYLDFHINFRIKRARMFLIINNMLQGLSYSYYSAPHYPLRDRGFSFGVNWLFYD